MFALDPMMMHDGGLGRSDFQFSGNAADRNSNWPSRAVMIPGDSAIISFTPRSPPSDSDRSRWGFRCVVRGIQQPRLPWLYDHQLSMSELMARWVSTCLTAPLELSLATRLQGAVGLSYITALSTQFAAENEMPSSLISLLSDYVAATSVPSTDIAKLKSNLSVYAVPISATTPVVQCIRMVNDVLQPLHQINILRFGLDEEASSCSELLAAFVAGDDTTGAHALAAHVDQVPVRFMGQAMVNRLPEDVRRTWHRSLRALIAAVVKHAGLAAKVDRCFGGMGGMHHAVLNTMTIELIFEIYIFLIILKPIVR